MTIPIPPGQDPPPGTLPGPDPRDVPPTNPGPPPGPDPTTAPPTNPGPPPGAPFLPGPPEAAVVGERPTPARETHGVPDGAYAREVWDDESPAIEGVDSDVDPGDSTTVTA